jgi:hypothetical protein
VSLPRSSRRWSAGALAGWSLAGRAKLSVFGTCLAEDSSYEVRQEALARVSS